MLQSLIYTAQRAGGAIMAVYATDFAVRDKADASPVTVADEAAEKIILEDLAGIAPGIPVVAEEAAAAGKLPDISSAAGGNRFFLVDPLDGTKEFISHRDEFTVNIALIEDGEPVLGVVFAPARRAPGSLRGRGPRGDWWPWDPGHIARPRPTRSSLTTRSRSSAPSVPR